MSAAWVTKEWRDPTQRTKSGHKKRCHQIAERGMRGVKEADRWVVEWLEPSGRRRREKIKLKGRPGKRLADERAEQLTSQLTLGTYSTSTKTLWSDFREEYDEKVLANKSPNTRRVANESLAFLEQLCQVEHVDDIRTRTIDTFKSKLLMRRGKKQESKMSHANVNKHLRHLKAALRNAHRWEYLSKLPEIQFLHEPEKLAVYMLPEHFDSIYRACENATVPDGRSYAACKWWQAVMVTGIMTGLRITEMMTLRWDDVFLDKSYLVVRHDRSKGKRDDIVPLHPVVVAHLRMVTDYSKTVFDWPLRREALWSEWTRLQEAAGIHLPCHDAHVHTRRCHVYGFHTLKKACGTLNAGRVPKPVLNAFMRHRSFATTDRYYLNKDKLVEGITDGLFVPESLR